MASYSVLRGECGFKGYVMSDWGAVNDRVKGHEAGLELEMRLGGDNDAMIVKAVKDGALEEKIGSGCRTYPPYYF